MSSIDLHIHSAISSDGEFSPEHILALSQERGLRVISLTDHNSVKGVKQALETIPSWGLTMIPGIEIDCIFRNLNLHVLGYGIDIEDPAFVEIEEAAFEQESSFFPRFIRRLQEIGFHIHPDDVFNISSGGIPAPEFIGEVLLNSSENQHDKRLLPYREGGCRSDMPYFNFYLDYCTPGKPAYIEKAHPDLSSIIHIITQSGGVPVLAHPGQSLPRPEKQLLPILEMGVLGIEVFSSYHTPEITRYYVEKVREYGVMMTCGSDFHGKNKPTIILGAVECDGLEHQIIDRILRYNQRYSFSEK